MLHSSEIPPGYLYLLLFFNFSSSLEDHPISPQMARHTRNGCLPSLLDAYLPVDEGGEPGASEPRAFSSPEDTGGMWGQLWDWGV